MATADFDGDEDLFMTHLRSEGHNLYVNNGSGVFEDRSVGSGLGPGSLGHTGFGTAWFDFDNDGLLDILAVNGTVHVSREAANDPRVLIGLGASAPLVRVQWPSGRVEEWPDVAVDRWTTLREGSGIAQPR